MPPAAGSFLGVPPLISPTPLLGVPSPPPKAEAAAAATVEPVEEDKTPAMSATEAAASPAPAAPAAAATTPEDLARIAKEAEGIVTELRAALETESGLLKSLNEKLAALHA